MTLRNIRAFEGRDISPTEEAVEAMRREAFRSSRGQFQRMMKQVSWGSLATSPTGLLVSAAPSSDLSRLRRVKAIVTIPKNNSNIAGWLGFVRQPEGLSVESGASAPRPGDPALLRPVPWQSNEDQATYVEAYLPAVNLATGGALHVYAATFSGSHRLYGVVTWVEERDLGS